MSKTFVKFGDVCEVQNGYAFDSKCFSSTHQSGMPLIRIRDILRGWTETYYTGDFNTDFIVKKGDFLIGMDGDFNIGQWKSDDALLNQRVCRLIPSEKINVRFLYYYLPTELQKINDDTTYATVKHLSSKQVKSISIPNLTLSEQQRIVDILDDEFAKIDALKENAEKNLQNAKDLFQAVLRKELEPKEGWEISTIGAECKTGSGGTPNKMFKEYYEGGNVPWLRSGEVCRKYITETEMNITQLGVDNSSAKLFPTNTVVVAMYGATAGQVGILHIPTTTNQAICGIFPNSKYIPEFIYYVIASQKKELVAQATGNAQPNISQVKVKGVKIPVIDIETQELIISRLDKLNEHSQTLRENYEKTITLCNDLKQALLRKAFNGEL